MGVIGELFHVPDEPWMAEAACQFVDPGLFFCNKGETQKVRTAKRVCNGGKGIPPCPVLMECRDWALRVNDRHAILGGTTERDRRVLRRQQRDAA